MSPNLERPKRPGLQSRVPTKHPSSSQQSSLFTLSDVRKAEPGKISTNINLLRTDSLQSDRESSNGNAPQVSLNKPGQGGKDNNTPPFPHFVNEGFLCRASAITISVAWAVVLLMGFWILQDFTITTRLLLSSLITFYVFGYALIFLDGLLGNFSAYQAGEVERQALLQMYTDSQATIQDRHIRNRELQCEIDALYEQVGEVRNEVDRLKDRDDDQDSTGTSVPEDMMSGQYLSKNEDSDDFEFASRDSFSLSPEPSSSQLSSDDEPRGRRRTPRTP